MRIEIKLDENEAKSLTRNGSRIKDWFQPNPQRLIAFENHSGHWIWQYLGASRSMYHTRHRFDNIARATQKLVEEVQTVSQEHRHWVQ